MTDISDIDFSSRTFPTDADMELWNSLTPEQQKAVILRDIDAGLASGASTESADEIFQRALDQLAHAG